MSPVVVFSSTKVSNSTILLEKDFAPNLAPFSGASSDNRHTKPAQKQDKNSKPTPPPTIWGEEEFSLNLFQTRD